jgi:hypothetical protein
MKSEGNEYRNHIAHLYEPSSLAECVDLLSRPVQRDNPLFCDPESVNRKFISDLVTGVGTEQPLDSFKRKDLAASFIHDHRYDITSRTCGVLGVSAIKCLLELEGETDDDGVPTDESEEKICGIMGRVIARMESVSTCGTLVPDALYSILNDKEQMIYHKYKLLRAIRSGSRMLADAQASPELALLSDSDSVAMQRSCKSNIATLNGFVSAVSRTIEKSILDTLANKESLFLNKMLLNELVETAIELGRTGKDWTFMADTCERIVPTVEKEKDEDIIKPVLRLLTADPRVVQSIASEPDTVQQIRDALKAWLSLPAICQEVKNVISAVLSSIP